MSVCLCVCVFAVAQIPFTINAFFQDQWKLKNWFKENIEIEKLDISNMFYTKHFFEEHTYY